MASNDSSGLRKLFGDARFVAALVDFIGSVALLAATTYAEPRAQDFVKFIIVGLQPLVIAIILSVTSQNNAQTAADAHVTGQQIIADAHVLSNQAVADAHVAATQTAADATRHATDVAAATAL